MCETCPFRSPIPRRERAELAAVPPEGFPCHSEEGYNFGTSDVQCRGHWQFVRKFAALTPAKGTEP